MQSSPVSSLFLTISLFGNIFTWCMSLSFTSEALSGGLRVVLYSSSLRSCCMGTSVVPAGSNRQALCNDSVLFRKWKTFKTKSETLSFFFTASIAFLHWGCLNLDSQFSRLLSRYDYRLFERRRTRWVNDILCYFTQC